MFIAPFASYEIPHAMIPSSCGLEATAHKGMFHPWDFCWTTWPTYRWHVSHNLCKWTGILPPNTAYSKYAEWMGGVVCHGKKNKKFGKQVLIKHL